MIDLFILTTAMLFNAGFFIVIICVVINQKWAMKKRDDFYLKQFSTSTNKDVIEFINETKVILQEIKEKI